MSREPDFSRLRYFVAVAEALNFREAADRLHVTQPALSRAIRHLELEVGFRLFERNTRHVSLTPSGRLVFEETKRSFDSLRRVVRRAAQLAAGDAGRLSIGFSSQAVSGYVPSIAVRLRDAFPNANVGMYMRSTEELLAELEQGSIDVAFLLSAACSAPLRHFPVSRERFVLLASKENIHLSHRKTISLKEVSECPFVIGGGHRWKTFASLVYEACAGAGFRPPVVEEANDIPLLMHLLSLNRGVTLYGAAVIPTLPPEIVAIPIDDDHATFEISLAWREDHETPLMSTFIAFTKEAPLASTGDRSFSG